MKTIVQLQAELRAAAEQVEALSQELAQFQPSDNKKGLDFTHIQAIGKRYPVEKHALTGADADFQRQYLTLLTAPLLLESQEPENGWLFLQRIICGAGCDIPLVDLQADAATITDQQLDAFSAAVIEHGLADALMLDEMLLYLACRGGEAMKDWLAALAELLGRTLTQVQELAQLAGFIATENKDGLADFTNRELSIPIERFNFYIYPILKNYTRNNGKIFSYWGDGCTPIAEEQFHSIPSNVSCVVIRNAIFAHCTLELNIGRRDLLMEDCVVRDIDNRSYEHPCFKTDSMGNVVIRRCRFENLYSNDYTVHIHNARTFALENIYLYNIQSTASSGYTLYFGHCQMNTVVMENIRSSSYWYYGDGGTASEDCYYRNCTGKTSSLPAGLKRKEGN